MLNDSVSRVSINIGDLVKEFNLVFKTHGGNSHHMGSKGSIGLLSLWKEEIIYSSNFHDIV